MSSPIACLPGLGSRTLVMGILNVTPDSFSDGGDFSAVESALAHAREMAEDGADIIDVGGESTRPGSVEVSAEEEMARVLPVISALAPDCPVPLSIDTYKAATAEAALKAGAKIINDIWGLQRDADMARVAGDYQVPVIVMHNRMVIDGTLDIIEDMISFFSRSIDLARKAGVRDADIILDPGVGFGKTFDQHVEAVARLPELKARLPYPVLIGTSRKSMLGILLDNKLKPKDRLYGTLASNVVAIAKGADILRVHDVRAHVEAALVAQAILAKGH